MKKLKILILSRLLHHANRHSKSEHFYAIKKQLLAKYGVFKQYDVQFIEGKKCFSCRGTGIYHSFDLNTGNEWSDTCWHCSGGWFKRPVWNILEKLQFGKYTFHQPWQRSYTKPNITVKVIEGYIDHRLSKHGQLALDILFILYDRKRWWAEWKKNIGFGYRVRWWHPRNYIHNIAYLIKDYKKDSPVNNFNHKIKLFCNKFGKTNHGQVNGYKTDDLPF